MARYDHQFWDDHSGDAETRATVDTLIRPGLLRAFPLPDADHTNDGRFRHLLDTLAQLRPTGSQASWQENT